MLQRGDAGCEGIGASRSKAHSEKGERSGIGEVCSALGEGERKDRSQSDLDIPEELGFIQEGDGRILGVQRHGSGPRF